MLFTSPLFLFLFLPLILAIYFLVPRGLRNLLLLAVSLVFYAWGEREYVAVLLASIALNYLFGLIVDRCAGRRAAEWTIGLAVVANLALLGTFKYANFLVDNVNGVLLWLHVKPVAPHPVHLPLGISFFTFHALSYVIDVYRQQVKALRDPIAFALYISFFPQAIAGPIVRYHEIAGQLRQRWIGHDELAGGVKRFILGLGKKVLIANTVAVPADAIFNLAPGELTAGLAWLGILCYTFQIYFDFSGYSDMAIGLALLFGFRFPENFNYPYVAHSVTEFWRRWHISLSTWYRDYLYIPLGGNRCGAMRVYLNLVSVFFLCGLWHGASWNFVLWGLFHGAFLVLERLGLGKCLAALGAPIGHLYTLLVVMAGWVLFRAATLPQALVFFRALGGQAAATGDAPPLAVFLNRELVLALLAGAIGSLPVFPLLLQARDRFLAACESNALAAALDGVCAFTGTAACAVVLLASFMLLATGTYNPFIYFRF
jgi:alginate O-acetyltransferase complex protein AlgI